ncbi:MAG TPA: sugar phosphate isomerase/epimerase [Gemmatimonadales bacterium]|nr:sugar phosphate isomerase/epimerase [Gemmatimonadales bacterium]
MNRRSFLQTTAAAMVAGRGIRLRPAQRLGPLGVQLYTLRSVMSQGMDTVLSRVAAIGYTQVEFAGYFDHTPQEIRAMLDRHGLVAPSSHLALGDLEKDPAPIFEASRVIGLEYLTTPWIPAERRKTLDDWRRVADAFNAIGKAAKRAGFKFAFHNHDYEFQPVSGTIPYDVLLTHTDPELVNFEMDIYWIVKGGQDPLAYFARYPGRFPMLHLKDMAASAGHGFADVGQGTIDFPPIFRHAGPAGVRYYFVENDQPAGSPYDSVRVSYEYLRRLTF